MLKLPTAYIVEPHCTSCRTCCVDPVFASDGVPVAGVGLTGPVAAFAGTGLTRPASPIAIALARTPEPVHRRPRSIESPALALYGNCPTNVRCAGQAEGLPSCRYKIRRARQDRASFRTTGDHNRARQPGRSRPCRRLV